ncbi:polysaccharide export protein, partial [Lasius niger]
EGWRYQITRPEDGPLAVIRLTEAFGPQNVYVSIYESGSWDDSKEMLADLDRELHRRGVPHRVDMSDVTHRDEMTKADSDKGEGWVDTPRNMRELRRIPYLARLRNKTIQDLLDLHDRGVAFDKVLFLNDVIFSTDDVLNLMDTNGGDFAAACSLDFAKPPLYYDTFALRDIEGRGHV